MSDHELAITFAEFFALFQAHYTMWVSVLFAFLIASYLAADKLAGPMVFIVIAIYSLFSLDTMAVMYTMNSDIVNLQYLMFERVQNGSSDLQFHMAAREDLATDLEYVVIGRTVVVIAGYVGSLWFFFYQRARVRSA